MDRWLIAAAATGDVDYLLRLIREDMLLLDTVALAGAQTPLHVASMRGHLAFVQQMLKLRKQFAYELNQDGFSPLHLASANGHLQIVLELLKVDHHLCAIKGREQRLPVHCAVAKGNIHVMKELLLASPETVEVKTARGETLLDLAVKNNQFAAFKLLVEHVKKFKKEQILNEKDNQGNTILHLATSRKQYEVVHFLLVDDNVTKEIVKVNSLNERGMTPLDVLLVFQSEAGDLEIQTALLEVGAKRGKDITSNPQQIIQNQGPTSNTSTTQPVASLEINNNQLPPSQQPVLPARVRFWPRIKELAELFGYKTDRDSASDVRTALLTVAILMATATYQAVLSPPGGLWQDDNSEANHIAGKSIMGSKNPATFYMFMIGKGLGFHCSLYMIIS